MSSKRNVGGMIITVAAPFKFGKKKSAYNRCIGTKLRGSKGAGIRQKFAQAAKECAGKA